MLYLMEDAKWKYVKNKAAQLIGVPSRELLWVVLLKVDLSVWGLFLRLL